MRKRKARREIDQRIEKIMRHLKQLGYTGRGLELEAVYLCAKQLIKEGRAVRKGPA